MSHWNYRIMRQTYEKYDETRFSVIETFYDDDGEVYGWVPNAAPSGGTPDELASDLKLMLGAFGKPVIDHADLPGNKT